LIFVLDAKPANAIGKPRQMQFRSLVLKRISQLKVEAF
jgi:hypothetical protein